MSLITSSLFLNQVPSFFNVNYPIIDILNILNLSQVYQCAVYFNPNHNFRLVGNGENRESIADPTFTTFLAMQLLPVLNCPIVINVQQQPVAELDRRTANELILVFNKLENVSDFLGNTLRYHWTRIVIFSTSMSVIKEEMAKFWENDVISFFGLHLDLKRNGKVGLYGFEPGPNKTIVLIKRPHPYVVELFNAHQFPVNVSFVDLCPSVIHKIDDPYYLDGMEGRIMVEVAKRFNLKARHAIAKDLIGWGWLLDQGKLDPKGAVGEVFLKYSHFAFGLMTATIDRNIYLDVVVGYNPMEKITWMVPKGAGPQSAIWVAMLVTEFDKFAWLAVALSWVVMLLAFRAMEDYNILQAMHRVYAIALGIPTKLPKYSDQQSWPPQFITSSRVLHFSWLLSTMVLAAAYQSAMAGRLAVPPVRPDINTLRELLDSSLTISGFINTMKILITDDNPKIIELYNRYRPTLYKAKTAVEKIKSGEQLAYMQQSTTFQHLTSKDSNLHVLSEYALEYHDSFVLRKWSPFTRGTQNVISGLVEGGFVKHWRDEYLTPPRPLPLRPTPLSIHKLLGVFILAAVGWVLAIIVFLAELTAASIKFNASKNDGCL